MWPTSIAVWKRSAPPQTGQASPSFGWRRSANSGSKSRPACDAAQVPAGAVGAGDELALAERLVGDHRPREADRAERAALGAEAGDDLLVGRGTEVRAERALQLRLLEPVVAAQEREHERAVVPHHRHRLRGRGQVDREQLGQRLAGARVRRLDLGGRVERVGELRRPRDAACDLEVGRVVAVLAGDEGVLAGAGRRQVVERLAAAHHPALRLDAGCLDAAALPDPLVGAPVRLEADVEAGLVAVERVRVLHDELADAQEAAAGPRLVSVLRLEVVPGLRQLPVALQLDARGT